MLELQPMIHKFKMKDKYFCLDVNSGIIHVIDELTDRVLDIYDGSNREAVHEALDATENASELDELMDEIDELIKEEMLYAPMSEEFKLVVEEKPIVKALCLNIAHDCNLACKYCFASQGDYGGVKRELMSFDVAKRAVDFLIAMSGTRQHCEIDFFGGEPLLNWDVVKQTVEYVESIQAAHNKIFKLTLTTNGVLLTQDKIDYVNEHNISLVLSIDGREEVHNRMRPSAGGTDTYKTVAKNLVNAVKQRDGREYYVRGTYTHNNLDFTKDVIAMSDLGFEHLSMEPVVGKEGEYVLRYEDLPILEKEYEKLADLYLQRQKDGWGEKFNFFHFRMDLYRGPCMAKRLRGCGAGHEYMAIVPNGDIYPCHQFVGRDGYVLGNVFEGLKNFDIPREFRNTHVFTKPTCAKCWAKFFCSGGCHANNETFGGSIKEPYELGCKLQKKRIECAIMIQAELDEMNQDTAVQA
ncbi:thioether cross-link-forming SCIFF peptide maturase [Veillonella magna]|uniref:Thioether cross-link-forming SCIFF peptide maturase n=1 Tax=Veillonella magna TaxID=464322 RepID=A0ABS2GGA6_9FIRM|nr:thioether cross-link-forming SCIFF peptide maturase [Veillonella magna]MBM6824887.1 thioether cross-link-forming SCIFF peptide maturase [Veillonella magna]MBM6913181.1 thioether cross-link-forming SCIFF peptide maturase [Veillonella magna]